MKIIYSKSRAVGNVATSVTASSENANYPAANLLLGDIGKVFRSITATPAIANITLTIAVPAGVTNAIGIFGCNATDMTIAVKDVTEATTYFTETFDLTPASPARTWRQVWKEWTSNGFALHIVITLTAPTTATYHEVGEIVVGEVVTIEDPQYGLSQGVENLQIIQKKAGGGFYIFDRPKPRTFELSFILTRLTQFNDLNELYGVMGQKPMAMLISELSAAPMEWSGYFHIMGPPKASHNYPTKSIVPLSLREAV